MPDGLSQETETRLAEIALTASAATADALRRAWLAGRDHGATEMLHAAGAVNAAHGESPMDVARMRQALLWIGPVCQSFTRGTCYPDRAPDAEYGADRWCDGCIAAHGLGVDPDRTHQGADRSGSGG